ncbi:MAG: LysR family transcriptional regulator [Rhodopila sp.]|jgi:DNA-binding transcriptional LysR family regulator
MDLQRIDLNLMVAFEALMAARSVSAAATRMGVSQPAMSGTLGRLRSLFDDELFVRSGRDMLPTVRAIQLEAQVSQALAQLRTALEPQAPFNPRNSRRVFQVSGGDYATMVILPRLAAFLAEEAPSVDLRFRFVEKDVTFELLDTDRLDLALGVFPDPPKRLGLKPLFDERFVCVARQNHPDLCNGLSLEAFVALPHVLVTERGDQIGAVDEALARLGLARRVALTVPHVLVVRSVLPSSNLIATVGARAGRLFAQAAPLTVYDAPVALPPWRMSMLWSRQKAGDPGLTWLRTTLYRIGAQV